MKDEVYWENLVKRSLCRFFLLAELDKGPMHGYGLNRAIQVACQGCCEPTEAMIYSTLKEMTEGGYVECYHETHGGRLRRVCRLTVAGRQAFQAAGRVWEKMLPQLQSTVGQALASETAIGVASRVRGREL